MICDNHITTHSFHHHQPNPSPQSTHHCTIILISHRSTTTTFPIRYPDSAAHFHEEEKEGVVKICQLAIHKKYPKYCTDGYEALFTKPPVFYISASAKHNLSQHICHQVLKWCLCHRWLFESIQWWILILYSFFFLLFHVYIYIYIYIYIYSKSMMKYLTSVYLKKL